MDTRKGFDVSSPFQYGPQKLKFVLLIVLVVICLVAVKQFKQSHYFPIKKVRVYGVNHLDSVEVQRALLPLVERNFFSVNVNVIRNQLLQFPWVSDLNVRRIWPNEVEINIIEKNPVAIWNEQRLLSDGGELFSPSLASYPSNLPKFSGPEGQQIEIMNYFKEINRIFIPLHVKISTLELTANLTWKLTLNNGISLTVGDKDLLLRLAQFVRVFPKIAKNHSGVDVDYVDLRYPNGMAVHWKKSISA